MTEIMTASKPMTDGQIETVVNHLRDAMRKHRSEISSEVAQQLLGTENLGMKLFSPFLERIEAISKMIVRKVDKVDRTKKPQEVLDATKCKQDIDANVVEFMPHGTGDGVEVVFFKLDRWVSDADLEKQYELRGLIPADPYSLAAANEADPAFADKHPNGTHWKDADGKWCYSTFFLYDVGCFVDVNRCSKGWHGYWWFAGFLK